MLRIINKKMAQRFCALRQMFKSILGVGNYGVKPSFSAVPPAGSFLLLKLFVYRSEFFVEEHEVGLQAFYLLEKVFYERVARL